MDLDLPEIESRLVEDITELYLGGERFALVSQVDNMFFVVDTFFDEEIRVCFSIRSATCYAMALAIEFEFWNARAKQPQGRSGEA